MKKITLAMGMAALTVTGLVIAQQAGFTRVPLQSQDLSIPGKVVVQARAEFDPGVAAAVRRTTRLTTTGWPKR